MIELYHVTTVVRKFAGYRNFRMHWFLRKKTRRRPYADLIENYYNPINDPRRTAAEVRIDEMFELDQANALKEYLDRNHPGLGTTTIEKANLPIPNDVYPLFMMDIDRHASFYELDEDPNYSLPFIAHAYFDLLDCELPDVSEACPSNLET